LQMKEITIRSGRVKDLPQVLELIKELAAYVGLSDQVENSVAQMEVDGFGDNSVYELLVAERDGAILGTSIYYYRYSTWKGKRLYLEDLVVKESERGKGIGKLLFEATMKKTLSEKCSGMMWQVLDTNKTAMDFYKKYNAKFDRAFINYGLESESIREILK